jgi:hypothetical protein
VATGLTDALGFLTEKLGTARSGSLAYIKSHPESFGAAGVREKQLNSEEVLQATQVLIDHIHRL